MRNPLHKRILRELRGDWKKYLALFLMLAATIGFVSGMFVANDSMLAALDDSLERYNVEYGHFQLEHEPTEALLTAMEAEDITIYSQPYKDFDEDVDGDGESDALIRVFPIREDINGICVLEGRLPSSDGEIAIDRMHADNQKLLVGDAIYLNREKMTVTGLISRLDYTTLYENASDMMFNALTFDIAVVTPEAFTALNAPETWQYAFLYGREPADQLEEKERSDELVERLAVLAATGGLYDDPDQAESFAAEAEDFLALAEQLENAQALMEQLEEDPNSLMDPEKEALLEEAQSLMEQAETDPTVLMDPEAAQTLQSAQDLMAQAEDDPTALLTPEAAAQLTEARSLLEDADQDALEAMAGKLEIYDENKNELTEFVPRYANQAIWFAPDDMSSDKSMGLWIMLILVLVLAFIFAITASNTISNEATVIGALRASGYTRGELLRHYVTPPILVTLLAAVAGNVLGYTVMKNVVVSMYYNSYSLPTYETLWSPDALLQTTVFPVLLMIAIQTLVIHRRLRLPPLKFLRNDLTRSQKRRAVWLPNWSFLRRFRMRILLRNLPSYLVLLIGLSFVMLLLAFSVGMPATLSSYEAKAAGMMAAKYQYILRDTEDVDGNEIVTSTPGAERFSMETLEAMDGVHVGEEVSVYGCSPDSAYFSLPGPLSEGEIYVSSAYADKFRLRDGDTITLKKQFSRNEYTFTVAGVYDYDSAVAAFLYNDQFNRELDLAEGSFSGYLSDQPIEDIDPDLIYTVITQDEILKMVKQLQHSMGDYMTYFSGACMLVAALILFLLTKIIIEKDAVSISMVKVLGYENREIDGLYILLTSLAVVVSAVIGLFIGKALVVRLWRAIMLEMNGWFTFYIGPWDMVKCVAMAMIAYVVVAFFDVRRIRRIPLTEALKTVE